MDPRTSAQEVMRCDLCETAVVQMHCDTCFKNLCKACVGEHASADLSKPHKIVDFKDRKSTRIYPACTSHDKELCEMYCKQCDFPICISCLASNQHLGHELSKLLQILDEKKSMIIKEQFEFKNIIYPTYQDIASDVQNRLIRVEKKYGNLSTAITKHGEDWHREIDKLVKKLKAEVDELKNTQLQTLQKQLEEINKTMSKFKNKIDSMDDAVDSNDIFKLIRVMSVTYKHNDLPEKIVPSLPKFTPGKIPEDELSKIFGVLSSSSLTSDKQGYSMKTTQKSPEVRSSLPVKQLLDGSKTVTTIGAQYGSLRTMSCLSDGAISTSGDDSNINIFSIDQGSPFKTSNQNQRYRTVAGGMIRESSQNAQGGVTGRFDSSSIETMEMPPIGSRVRRGPDWKWWDQDNNLPGTVVDHRARGYLVVEWDNRSRGKYRYGVESGAKDVRIVDEPRMLPPGMKVTVGVRVRRGKDWEWGPQDGGEGSSGVIYKVQDDGIVHVRWDNGKKANYRFGLFGKYDIEVCPQCIVTEEATGNSGVLNSQEQLRDIPGIKSVDGMTTLETA